MSGERLGTKIRKGFQQIIPFIAAAIADITVEGEENIPDCPQLLIVANHSTFIDVPLLLWALRRHTIRITWVVNKKIYDLWCLKWMFIIHKGLPVTGHTVEKIIQELNSSRWVMIFPEGGANLCPPILTEEEKKKPRRGAAVAALSTGVNILPICIIGADKVLPARSFRLKPRRKVTVRIGKPFSYDKIDTNSVDQEFLIRVRQEIIGKIFSLNTVT